MSFRWEHYETSAEPLGRLLVSQSFDTHRHQEKSVKTQITRLVPVHDVLAKMLDAWRQRGWPALFGRQPTKTDLIIPSRELKNRNVNHGLKRFREDLDRLGMRARRQHDTRRTFITLARRDGARADILEAITHGPRGDIINIYTTLPWDLLCEEVAKLKILQQGPKKPPQNGESSPMIPRAVDPENDELTADLLQRSQVAELSMEKWRGGRDSKGVEP